VSKEASKLSGFVLDGGGEGSCSDALEGAASEVEISLLSDYPNAAAFFEAWAHHR
jgi:hypothetical protein